MDELQEEEKKWRESGAFTGDPKELERRVVKMKKCLHTILCPLMHLQITNAIGDFPEVPILLIK